MKSVAYKESAKFLLSSEEKLNKTLPVVKWDLSSKIKFSKKSNIFFTSHSKTHGGRSPPRPVAL